MRKDLTSGSITKTILVTAMPMVFALLLRTGFNIVDAIFVGRISPEAIAAVSLAFPIMFFIHAIAGGIEVGGTSLILTLLRVIVITIPVALLLAFTFRLGLLGVWLSFVVSTVVSGIASLLWFRTGRWKKGHIRIEEVPRVVG